MEVVECAIMFFSIQLLVNCDLYVLSPQLMAMDDGYFQVRSSLHPNDVCEAKHVCQIHDIVPLEVVDCAIMFFSIQLLVNCEIVCAITPIEGNR
jgi:hypothetical protein